MTDSLESVVESSPLRELSSAGVAADSEGESVASARSEGFSTEPEPPPLMPEPRWQTRKRQKCSSGLGHVAGGTVAYYKRAAHLPAGPESVEELADWPRTLLRDMAGAKSSAMCRLAALLEAGLIAHTDCSGQLTPECAMQMLFHYLETDWHMDIPEGLILWRTCDKSRLCERMALENTVRMPFHVFHGMLE
eukprot:1019273-Alexandrium_andersonii.AAC.1